MGEALGHRGGSFYDDPRVLADYLRHRDAGVSSPNVVMEEPAVLAEIGDPSGLRVVDLGCGDARLGRTLLARGARSYLGLDGSELMVERARIVLAHTVGEVRLGDLEEFQGVPGETDLVVCRLVLHYVAEIGPVLRAATAVLSDGGRIVITVVHPVITSWDNSSLTPRTAWTVDDYFSPGPRPRTWLGSAVTWYHRTIADYVDALRAAGLKLENVGECPPVAELFAGHDDELARRRRAPLFLLVAGRR